MYKNCTYPIDNTMKTFPKTFEFIIIYYIGTFSAIFPILLTKQRHTCTIYLCLTLQVYLTYAYIIITIICNSHENVKCSITNTIIHMHVFRGRKFLFNIFKNVQHITLYFRRNIHLVL